MQASAYILNDYWLIIKRALEIACPECATTPKILPILGEVIQCKGCGYFYTIDLVIDNRKSQIDIKELVSEIAAQLSIDLTESQRSALEAYSAKTFQARDELYQLLKRLPNSEELATKMQSNNDLTYKTIDHLEKKVLSEVTAVKDQLSQIERKLASQIPTNVQLNKIAGTCPKCRFPLVWRQAKITKEFYKGCTNYPKCNYNERSYKYTPNTFSNM